MNPFDLQRFNQAVGLAQAGQKVQAQSILRELNLSNPEDANLLLWMAFTSDNLADARNLLGNVARINPANPSLASAQSWLAAEEAKQQSALFSSSYLTAQPDFNSRPAAQMNYTQPAPTYSAQPQQNYQATPSGYDQSAFNQAQAQAAYQTSQPPRRFSLTLIKGLIVAAPVVLGLLIIVILAVLGPQLAADSVAAQGLPVYSGARRIELTATDRATVEKTFEQGFSSTGATGVKIAYFEVYAIKAADKSKTFSFYDTELKKQSWVGTPGNPATRGATTQSGYLKGSSVLGLVSSVVTANDGPLNNTRYKLGSDELLLLVFGAERTA
jgi:hypothetical protein